MNKAKFPYFLAIQENSIVRFADLAHLIAKAMHPDDHEDVRNYAAARVNLDDELRLAVRSGGLFVRNPAGMGRHTFPVGAALNSAVLLPADLRTFLEERGIELRLISQISVTEPTIETKIIRHKLRTNSLDRPIEKAIVTAGSLATSAVFQELKALALDSEKPFSGAIEGDALWYTNDDNKSVKLTKNALDHRLRARRNAEKDSD